MNDINFHRLTPADAIIGEDQAETHELKQMLARAEAYIQSFSWCPRITERYLGVGIGGVIALFLFKFDLPINGRDHCLWVVEGDLPSAYFVTDVAHEPESALRVYCDLMDSWADAVTKEKPLDEVFPIAVSPTIEHAEMLRTRTKFIREQILL